MVVVHEEQQKCIQQQWRLQEKGKTRSNPDETRSSTESGAFQSLTPNRRPMYFFGGFSLISPNFRPNSTILVPCFPEFVENTVKHPKNWCPHVLIPRQKIFNRYIQRFSKSRFPMGENRRAGHLCVGKPPILALRIGMKTLKVLIEKVRTTQRQILPTFPFEHLQHYSGDDLTNFFPHPSLVLYSFATPPVKLKPRGPIIVMGQPSRQR